MIETLVTLKINAGENAQFEAIFKELMAQVRANEPGCLTSQLVKGRADANTHKVFELYKDEAAFEAHRTPDHFRTLGQAMGAHIAGRPEIEHLDSVI